MHQKLFYRSHYLMHSRFELIIPELESGILILLFEKIVERIINLEKLLSRFIEDSTTSLLNANASISPLKVSEYYFSLIEKCMIYHQKTKGLFNICAGSKNPDISRIKMNKQEHTINFESSDISIDFGAIGKGLAIEQSIQIIKDGGIENALINFGDSSVYAIGSHPQGEYWPVKIENGENCKIFQLKDEGLSSSGLHVINDQKIAHIINPFTGKLTDKKEKVVIMSDCPVRAEVLSTAIYAADENVREEIKRVFNDEQVFIV